LGWALAVLFLIDALFTILIAITRHNPNRGQPRLPRAIRIAVFPHVVMDLGMTLMLVAVL
jgi:hypothetical protein